MYKDRNPEITHDGVTAKTALEVPGMMEAFTTGKFDTEMLQMVALHFHNAFRHYHTCLKEKQAWRELMAQNLTEAKAHPAVHPDFAAAIGYCFGGQCVLDMGKCVRNAKQRRSAQLPSHFRPLLFPNLSVRMGCPLQGVVSFHGLLQSEPENLLGDPNFDGTVNEEGCVNNYATNCQVLI
jgi:dienelactone hydrolase